MCDVCMCIIWVCVRVLCVYWSVCVYFPEVCTCKIGPHCLSSAVTAATSSALPLAGPEESHAPVETTLFSSLTGGRSVCMCVWECVCVCWCVCTGWAHAPEQLTDWWIKLPKHGCHAAPRTMGDHASHVHLTCGGEYIQSTENTSEECD